LVLVHEASSKSLDDSPYFARYLSATAPMNFLLPYLAQGAGFRFSCFVFQVFVFRVGAVPELILLRIRDLHRRRHSCSTKCAEILHGAGPNLGECSFPNYCCPLRGVAGRVRGRGLQLGTALHRARRRTF
jgi:hypothetical protein